MFLKSKLLSSDCHCGAAEAQLHRFFRADNHKLVLCESETIAMEN